MRSAFWAIEPRTGQVALWLRRAKRSKICMADSYLVSSDLREKSPGRRGPFFRPPAAPEDAASPVRAELERLRAELLASKTAEERARLMVEEHARIRESAEERARSSGPYGNSWRRTRSERRLSLTWRLDAHRPERSMVFFGKRVLPGSHGKPVHRGVPTSAR